MVLASHSGGLVATERGPSGVEVITVGPHPSGLYRAAHTESTAAVAGPHAGAKPVHRVVGYLQRLGLVAECGDGEHGAEYLLLEDPHVVGALESGWLEIVPTGQFALHCWGVPTNEELGALFQADLDIAFDLLQLRLRYLRADLRGGIERVSLTDRTDALQTASHELLIDRLLDQCA